MTNTNLRAQPTSVSPTADDEPKPSANVGASSSLHIDDILSKEMQALSFQDRLQIQEEIHGVTNLCPEETPEMIDEALHSMQQHLDHIQHKPVYDRLSSSSYLHTKDWRLRFLRCELFDSKKAAERLVKFTEYMNEEYDKEVLERPLRLSDLETKTGKKGKEIMQSFRSGHSQLLPFRDRSGRRIMFTHSQALVFDGADMELKYKAFEYLFFVASGDEETQRKGVVGIHWIKGVRLPMPDRREPQRTTRFFEALPVRIASLHQCLDKSPVTQIVRSLTAIMLKGQMRLQLHLEDELEVRYKLLGFGIPVDLLPVTDTNNIKNKNFNQWIKGRKNIEALEAEKRRKKNTSPHGLVECPSSSDVVFKVGTSNWNHPGNAVYRELLEADYDEYNHAPTNVAKQAVVSKILEAILERNGSFLEWSKSNSCWVVMQDIAEIRMKIYNNMVYFSRQVQAKKNLQSNTSCTYMFERQDGRKRKRTNDGVETQCCTKVM